MEKASVLKPQDILMLLKIVSFKGAPFAMKDLAAALKISPSEVSEGLERCRKSALIDADKQQVQKLSFLEFLQHGLKYVYPVQPGAKVRGIATAFSASPVKEQIVQTGDVVVWPYAKGTARGLGIRPLYKTVPEVVGQDEELYQLLSMVECLRLGRRREVEIALSELKKRFDYE